MHNESQVFVAALAGAASRAVSAALLLSIRVHSALCMLSHHGAANTSARTGDSCVLGTAVF